MKNITKVEKQNLLGFVKEIGGPGECQRCVETKDEVDLVYYQMLKNNPAPIITIVKFTSGENSYNCLICRESEERDVSARFNNYLNSITNENQ